MLKFPVLMTPSNRKKYPDCPTDIPWTLIAPHDRQAQSLIRLAEHGGLSHQEMYYILNDREYDNTTTMEVAIMFLNLKVKQHAS